MASSRPLRLLSATLLPACGLALLLTPQASTSTTALRTLCSSNTRPNRLGCRAYPRLCQPPESGASSATKEGDDKALSGAEAARLLADDEYLNFALECGLLVRQAVAESVTGAVSDFTGKSPDEYKLGDISKEADARIKEAVADLRNKEEYELGDLTVVLDEVSKAEVCRLTGKDEYAVGDLSIEIDKRIKNAAARFCGKEEGEYQPGDLSIAVDARVKDAINSFTGQDKYNFGDVSREIERRRTQWVKDFVGKEEGEYEFGDITKKAMLNYLGEDYAFGDLTKKAVSSFTGKENYQFGDITRTVVGKMGDFFSGKDKK